MTVVEVVGDWWKSLLTVVEVIVDSSGKSLVLWWKSLVTVVEVIGDRSGKSLVTVVEGIVFVGESSDTG